MMPAVESVTIERLTGPDWDLLGSDRGPAVADEAVEPLASDRFVVPERVEVPQRWAVHKPT